MNILGTRIKKERENLNLSREDLAKKIGVSYSAIAMYEQGNREPNNEILLKMCKIFDCSMDYLMGNSEHKKQPSLNEIRKRYYEKSEILLKNKYINEFSKLGLTESEIENLMKIITSNDNAVTKNYLPLLDNIFFTISNSHNKKDIVNQIRELIINYNKEKISIINEELNAYEQRRQKSIDILKKGHFDKLHPSISGKESASLTENVDAVLNYMDKKNMDEVFLIPILGKITAGQPILVEENIEGYLPVDPNIYGVTTSDDLFYLRVSGESMNLKVKNGDYALIRKQDYAEDGDIIVAIVNGNDEATLKRYKKINDEIVMLEPMSTYPMEPIIINLKETNFKIIGKAIGYFGKI